MTHFKAFLTIFALILGLTASGCAKMLNPYEESFSCKAPTDDGRCLDTPTAYQEAVQMPDLDSYPAPAAGSLDAPLHPQPQSPRQEVQSTRYRMLTELLNEPQTPLLEPPRVLRVLLLPYRGSDNELFMARHVFIKVEESTWVLTDLKER